MTHVRGKDNTQKGEIKLAISIIGKKWVPGTISDMTVDYLCDTDADFVRLPKSIPGSKAVSVLTGNIKVVNASGEWVDFLK